MKRFLFTVLLSFWVILTVGVFLPVNVQAQFTANSDQPLKLSPNVTHGTLSNGLKYYILPNKKPEKRVELRLVINAGSIQEDDDQKGLAHFVEHMAFNGTKNFKKNDLINYLESLGVKFGPDLNAYTSFDETVYMLQLPTENEEVLKKGFTVLADWAFGISFEGAEIDKERGVIMSEWRTGLGAEQRMRNKYFGQLFFGSRYVDRLPIGDTSIIKNAPYEAFTRFYNDWYRPDLMAVIVVGDVDVAKVEKMIKDNFSQQQNPVTPRKRADYFLPPHDDIKVSVVSDKEATRNIIRLLYKHPSVEVNSVGTLYSSLKRELYNEMMNQRLEEISLSPESPFLFAYSGYGSQLRNADAYYSYASAADDKIEKALFTLITENERVKRHGFTNTELERAKANLMKEFETNFSEKDKIPSSNHARNLVNHFLSNDPFLEPEVELNLAKVLLPRVTVKEINELAKQWITDNNAGLVITKPENNITLKEENLLKVIADAKAGKIDAYKDFVSDKPLLEKIPEKGMIIDKTFDNETGVYKLTLENSLKVHYKITDFKNDEILMNSYVWGGHSLCEDKDYWSCVFADAIMDEAGVGNFSKTEIQKMLAGKTAEVAPYISELENGFTGKCKPADLETMLQLVYLYYTSPRHDTSSFKAFKTRQVNTYKNLLTDPQHYFNDRVQKIIYKDHPRVGYPTEKDMENLNLDAAYDFFQKEFKYSNAVNYFFIGNIEVKTFENLVETYLGSIPNLTRFKPEYNTELNKNLTKGSISTHFKMGIAPRSNVYIRMHLETENPENDELEFNIVTSVLRIMLRESMREDKGGVYGVRVTGTMDYLPKSIYNLIVSFNADPPMTQELIDLVMEGMNNLKNNGPSSENMKKVKEAMTLQMQSDLKENSFWLRQMVKNSQNNTSLNNLLGLIDKAKSLTAEDIQIAARKLFENENYIEISMYPME